MTSRLWTFAKRSLLFGAGAATGIAATWGGVAWVLMKEVDDAKAQFGYKGVLYLSDRAIVDTKAMTEAQREDIFKFVKGMAPTLTPLREDPHIYVFQNVVDPTPHTADATFCALVSDRRTLLEFGIFNNWESICTEFLSKDRRLAPDDRDYKPLLKELGTFKHATK